jgi:hypothetical protein
MYRGAVLVVAVAVKVKQRHAAHVAHTLHSGSMLAHKLHHRVSAVGQAVGEDEGREQHAGQLLGKQKHLEGEHG